MVLHKCCSWCPHTGVRCRSKLSVQTPGGVTKKGRSCVSKGPFGCVSLAKRGRKYPARPSELDVRVTQEGFGWGLWQLSEQLHLPSGFWSQLCEGGAEVRYSLIEKQLAAVYAALLATEAITETAPVTVRTIYPIAGWVRDWMAKPPSGMAQMPTLAKCGAYLQHRSTLSTNALRAEL